MSDFDVFLSHSNPDKPAVEEIARRLEDEAGLKPFLDKWHLVPGEPWQEALEEALANAACCAVFVGPGGITPWEHEEMRTAIGWRVSSRKFRVIPVLLPGSTQLVQDKLPSFLLRTTWVDFRGGLDDVEAFQYLVSGIKGIPPGRSGRAVT